MFCESVTRESAFQGDRGPGMRWSSIGCGVRNKVTNCSKASLPCCQHVRPTLVRIC